MPYVVDWWPGPLQQVALGTYEEIMRVTLPDEKQGLILRTTLFISKSVTRKSSPTFFYSNNLHEMKRITIILLLFNFAALARAQNAGPSVRTDGCGIVTARSGSTVKYDGAKAFDNNNYTKWVNAITSGVTWIQYQFCSNASYVINSYALTSADDMVSRDPKTIKLSGSNNGVDFTLLDSRTNIVFSSRFQTQTFGFTNNSPYKYYRFDFTSSPGSDGLQLSEIELVETGQTETAPADSHAIDCNPGFVIEHNLKLAG